MKHFELQTLTEYTDAAILQELKRVAHLHSEGPLTKDAYRRLSPKVSWRTVQRRFGSWGKGLAAAGLSHLFLKAHMPYGEKLQRGKAMSNDELIAEMKRVHKSVGKYALTTKDFDGKSVTHAEAIRDRFGGWHEALEKAGIGKSDLGKRYTDLQCYENIFNLWAHYGRQPRHHELKKPPSTVGPKAYVRRWGSWRGALAAFVQWANAEDQDDPEGESPPEETASLPTPMRTKPQRLLP